MVISMAPLAPTCAIAPAGLAPIQPGFCSIPYNQISSATVFTNGPLVTTPVPCAPTLSPTLVRAHSSPSSPSPCNVLAPNSPVLAPNNGVLPSNFVSPCTTSLQVTNGVYAMCLQYQKLDSSQASTPSRVVVPYNPAIYTCSPIPGTAVVPYTQRMVNGSSVVQCTPGVCPIASSAMLPNSGMEVCPVEPPAPLLPNGSEILPMRPLPPLCTTVPWRQTFGMDQVWQREFRKLFDFYAPHRWLLYPIQEKPVGEWNANVDSAKVRFCCEDCGHGWTSMKGRVGFWYVLNSAGEGYVLLKLYGQKCDRCETGNYELAMWYPEEVLKVMVNIYNKVGQTYYAFYQAPYHKARRPGKPRTPHNSELCQACKDGVCAERR